MSKTYEMLWDCEYCGAKKLLGKTHRHCPSCGAAQADAKRYFPAEDEKVAVEDHEFVGKDKVCAACDTPNSAKATFCTSCGSPMDGSKEVKLVGEEDAQAKPQAPETPKKSSMPIILGLVALLAIIFFIFSLKESKDVTVTGHSWSRSIEIEKYQTVKENDWKDKVPLDGKVLSCTDKERSTEKVADGEECSTVKKDNGDGTYNESQDCQTKYKEVPVYDAWCSYQIDKWTVSKTEKTSASDLKPIWPTLQIHTCAKAMLNCEREGKRSESYIVHLTDPTNKKFECAFDEKKWSDIKVNSSRQMDFGKVTGNIDCASWDKKK